MHYSWHFRDSSKVMMSTVTYMIKPALFNYYHATICVYNITSICSRWYWFKKKSQIHCQNYVFYHKKTFAWAKFGCLIGRVSTSHSFFPAQFIRMQTILFDCVCDYDRWQYVTVMQNLFILTISCWTSWTHNVRDTVTWVTKNALPGFQPIKTAGNLAVIE